MTAEPQNQARKDFVENIKKEPDYKPNCLIGHIHHFRILRGTLQGSFPCWQCLYCKTIITAT